jgi:hypothetical protein
VSRKGFLADQLWLSPLWNRHVPFRASRTGVELSFFLTGRSSIDQSCGVSNPLQASSLNEMRQNGMSGAQRAARWRPEGLMSAADAFGMGGTSPRKNFQLESKGTWRESVVEEKTGRTRRKISERLGRGNMVPVMGNRKCTLMASMSPSFSLVSRQFFFFEPNIIKRTKQRVIAPPFSSAGKMSRGGLADYEYEIGRNTLGCVFWLARLLQKRPFGGEGGKKLSGH